MGYATAAAFSDAVQADEVSLERALGYHLTANFYPSLTTAYVQPLIEALQAVAEDDGALMISLPDHLLILPATAEKIDGTWMVDADTLVSIARAEPFLTHFVQYADEEI